MAHIVVLGAGLGGVVMAYEMKDLLGRGDEITVDWTGTSPEVRAGINSLPRGQRAAGLALGFTLPQTYRYVLLPITAANRGHSTTYNASLWSSHLSKLLGEVR